MRVAVVTESFLPQVNGVANTVRHVVEHLGRRGHEALVIAPAPGKAEHAGAEVVRVRSVRLPGYRSFPVGLPDPTVLRALERFAPDVVHLASPIALGATGLRAARRLDLPTVGVYQTDVSGFARQYGVRADVVIDRWVGRLHQRMDRTLVPSRRSQQQLAAVGVADTHLWRRGVALDLFDPARRDDALRASWGLEDRVAVGYVGRLAAEKQVRRLEEVARVPGVRLVVVGDGPERAWLEQQIPDAVFTGFLAGTELARAFASLDVFVHPGEAETFCQTVQEAQASGVPVVAPAAGGPLDLVRSGVTGLLYDPADRWSLRRAVARLGGDPALRTRVAEAARSAVSHRPWSVVVDELLDVHYPAVLARAPRLRAA
jgi:phosphatidylinositol alpha 1,6-mannosyltransferase